MKRRTGMNGAEATMMEHLTELRRRLLWVAGVMAASMIAGFFVARRLIAALIQAETASGAGLSLNAFSPWDGIRIYMHVSFLAGLVVTLPFALLQMWLYVKPGLTESEKTTTLRCVPTAALFGLAGLAFGYFVLFPMAFRFTTVVTEHLGLNETYGVAQYFSFLFNLVLPMCLLFQLPVVVSFLTGIGLLTPMRLRKIRRGAYLGLIIVATLVTPPDLISDLLVAAPLILLYEISVLYSVRSFRRKQERHQAREKELSRVHAAM